MTNPNDIQPNDNVMYVSHEFPKLRGKSLMVQSKNTEGVTLCFDGAVYDVPFCDVRKLRRWHAIPDRAPETSEDTTNAYPLPQEFYHIRRVMEMGAKKYEDMGWLEPNGQSSSHKEMHGSMFRHIAESYAGETKDSESGEHPLLHAATRCLMAYTRYMRGVKNDKDV